ncbi:hypothetical protein A3Q56_08252, partial [Intoshia linei]
MINDIIQSLTDTPFECRNIAEKRSIIEFGRPTPLLITTANTRNFQMKWYEKIDWLCENKVIYNEIYNEVEFCFFISVQADETTDCAMYAQLSIIIRCVCKSKIIERFIGFFDI